MYVEPGTVVGGHGGGGATAPPVRGFEGSGSCPAWDLG